jgi:hypothetical protein
MLNAISMPSYLKFSDYNFHEHRVTEVESSKIKH